MTLIHLIYLAVHFFQNYLEQPIHVIHTIMEAVEVCRLINKRK